jgi:hypothetical protein
MRSLSKVLLVDQRMRLECGGGFRQLRTCSRKRPGQLWAKSGHLPRAKISAPVTLSRRQPSCGSEARRTARSSMPNREQLRIARAAVRYILPRESHAGGPHGTYLHKRR